MRGQPTPVRLRVILLLTTLLAGCLTPSTPPPPVATSTAPTPAAPTVAPIPPLAPSLAAPTPVIAADAWVPSPRTKTTGCAIQAGPPDPACTPGAVDPRVSQTTEPTTICRSGYTATVRPPVSVTDRIKREQMAAYGLQGQPLGGYELDHLISLELGGAPADLANLWPEPWTGEGNAHQKDSVENFLNREVCRGTIHLVDAQRMIATDWLAVYRSRGLTPSP
jgi:hypothetical protein